MKTLNILNDVCKTFIKRNPIIIGNLDEQFMGVTVNGFCMYFLHKADFPFDIKALCGGSLFDVKRLIPKETTDAVLTCDLKSHTVGQIQRLTDGQIDVWINTGFQKNFDKTCTYKISTSKTAVLVYENENLAGLIMPVNVK